MSPSPERIAVLASIANTYEMVLQWAGMKDYQLARDYEVRCETLIELLEVHDCGSKGGFDKGQDYGPGFLARLIWVTLKYDSRAALNLSRNTRLAAALAKHPDWSNA